MGGSGGGGVFKGIDPIDQARKVRESEKKMEDSAFETRVNEILSTELSAFNDRDTNTIQKILDTIKTEFEGKLQNSVDLLFGGSISKHTYVDGLSDIDALVFLDQKEIADKSPKELLSFFGKALSKRYGEENVWEGKLAVTVKVKGHEIQLLPALKIGEEFKIASFSGNEWSRIQPQKFTGALTKINQIQGGKVVPIVKLAKAVIANLPEKQQLSGYHIESLAVNIFKNYSGSKTPKIMLSHFFEHASSLVLSPIKDSTGQSVHVDEYMGKENSVNRRVVGMAFQRISRRMKNADGMRSLDQWKRVLGYE